MAGTWASYQGLPCVNFRIVRSIGFSSDTSWVDVPASAVLDVRRPRPLRQIGYTERSELGAIEQDGEAAAFVAQKLLMPEGTFVMAHANEQQGLIPLLIAGLFVVRVETIKDGGEIALFRIYLADERWFWPRGLMERWSFNRTRGDGTVAADSLKADGSRWSLEEIVLAHIAPAMFRSPKVAATPKGWATDRQTPWEFRPFEPGLGGLQNVVRATGIAEPTLRLDRTLALHEAGDGKVALCKVDKGGVPSGANEAPPPEELKLWKDGTGQGATLELGWPEEYVLVVGGPRVATVALDHCEPVLVIKGKPYPLNEATVRQLTLNKYGLEWLSKFVLEPAAYQHVVGLEEKALKLLREQAWRLWRIPGAVVYDKDGDARPGPNAHLLPLLRQADTHGGRRRAPALQRYGFETISRATDRTREEAAITAAAEKWTQARDTIQARAIVDGKLPPFSLLNPSPGPRLWKNMGFGPGGSPFRSFSLDTFEHYRREAANVVNSQSIDAGLAGELDAALRERFAAEDALNGTSTLGLYESAKEYEQISQQLLTSGKSASDPEAAAQLKVLGERLRKLDEAAQKKRADRATRDKAGIRRGRPIEAVYFQNQEREEDAHATVAHEDWGIFRSSGLAGWVASEAVSSGLKTVFLPKPVRIVFGAVVRPRTDRPIGAKRQATLSGLGIGPAPVGEAPENHIPEALTDEESVFRIAFQRTGRGEAKEVNPDRDVLRWATYVHEKEWCELVPMSGAGNLATLREQSLERAREIFRRPDVIRSSSHVFAFPQPINTDGLVNRVEWRMAFTQGAPCGIETIVTTGTSGFVQRGGTQERRTPRPLRPDDDRERVQP